MGYFKILVFPFHDVGSLAICTNAISLLNIKALALILSEIFYTYGKEGEILVLSKIFCT